MQFFTNPSVLSLIAAPFLAIPFAIAAPTNDAALEARLVYKSASFTVYSGGANCNGNSKTYSASTSSCFPVPFAVGSIATDRE